MKREYLLIMIAAAMMLPGISCPAEQLRGRSARQMEFREFIDMMKDREGFEVTVEGAPRKSFFTGKTYVHYETVAYFGQDDSKSSRRILYHTEDGFTVRYNNIAVAADFHLIRTSLSPSFEKTYTKNTTDATGSEAEKSIRAMLDEEKVPVVLIAEFGLEAGKKYYARVKTESYHLPPREPDGKPQRKENRVLLISGRQLPNTIELTPLYQSWSY
jgi:hypothetical protein